MTYLQKWQGKLAEAKSGEDFLYTLQQMDDEIYEKRCYPATDCYVTDDRECEKCKATWLNQEMEVEHQPLAQSFIEKSKGMDLPNVSLHGVGNAEKEWIQAMVKNALNFLIDTVENQLKKGEEE